MAEMRPFLVRFHTALDGGLMSATRGECEEFIASHASPFRANYAWRSLRSFYAWLAEERETISPMAKVKRRVPLTDVKVAEADDISRLLRACSPFRTTGARRGDRLAVVGHGSAALRVGGLESR
jgi:integrase